MVINHHAASYTWKRLGKPLDMEKTLEENGIADETAEFEQYRLIIMADLRFLKANGTCQPSTYTLTTI
jgi:hypothetical protein